MVFFQLLGGYFSWRPEVNFHFQGRWDPSPEPPPISPMQNIRIFMVFFRLLGGDTLVGAPE